MQDGFFEIPETAIQAFEKLTGLHVVLHHKGKTIIWPYIAPTHMRHNQPHCASVINSELRDKCYAFDVELIDRQIMNYRSGRIQVCHAGFVEWVAPVVLDERLVLTLFAGQRTVGEGLEDTIYRDPSPASPTLPLNPKMPPPEPIDRELAETYLEALRQLASRLRDWIKEAEFLKESTPHLIDQNDLITRSFFVLLYIERRYMKKITLDEIADVLCLSRDRVAHIVKESFGKSFGALVTEVRIRAAKELLLYSTLSVSDIALQCGFAHTSQFHIVFKRYTNQTPLEYRASYSNGVPIHWSSGNQRQKRSEKASP